ncbi:aliphatic sulfonate ABC transporter substrate-binding protein [Paraclostridium bifermentans]|uniref:Aliphatic sulfonate ABC transporter substrate-binding protein n=1 Tax=Paraclostridium bifermentans TaxID=1490 RepID=A0AA44IHP4_PARBF|nr:aliphatic sulfonate ABC transporter substrate-binding protein [Paraclostridium bifermentans]MBN8048194.1 aliphatic sulfonate ABC transporter substrate-binding protein [Paraclostridium bifermentans]NME10057.1 aliphatic sulfonate ABC transporter substrate-binding protein [Paraclostridium bifermentans]
MKLSKSIKIKLTSVLATGVLMISMVGCTTTKEASLDKLVITHVTSPLNVPSIIQKNKNIFANEFSENGKDIAIDYAEITSGADQTQALASGDVDILYAVGGTSVVSAVANGADIKILNMYSRSPEAFCMYSLDENIKSAQDLKGKTIAGPVGTNLHQLLVAYLEKAGMTIDDVNYVNMSIADAKAALDGKSVDAALVAGPTAYKAEQQGYNLVTNGKGLTDAVIAVAVREDFYNEHKEEVELFMKAQENVNKYMNENYDETMEIVSKELDLDKSAVEEMYKQYDFSIETTDADRKAFQNVADFMLKTGMIEEEVKTNELFIK